MRINRCATEPIRAARTRVAEGPRIRVIEAGPQFVQDYRQRCLTFVSLPARRRSANAKGSLCQRERPLWVM